MDKEVLINLFKGLTELGENLQKVVENIFNIADHVHTMYSSMNDEKKPKKDSKISLEDVRKVLAGKSQDGFREEVKSLISKYGASKLSDIKPEKYEELLKEAEVLGNE